ncbi:MAG: DUF4955 domain-containing protein [Gemmatimonadetes bacterium]|nr:DUF4955 domain-containing protein [Gemmatimonadota bacterium]MYK50149.1 DUF4955 domain-containing protein [Gemmatimonadota bacterium]
MSRLLRVRSTYALSFAIILIALLSHPLSLAAEPSPDFDGSGIVDFPDFLLFVGAFGSQEGQKKYEVRYDLTGDGAIGFDDFLIFASSFGKAVNQVPVFSFASPVIRSVDENTSADTPIGKPISATDADNHVLTYSLRGPDASAFTIIPDNGQLLTREGVSYDYEIRRVYSVMVNVRDGHGGTDSIAVRISVRSPQTSSTYRQFVEAKENGTEPILPDFSYAGYHHFSKPVPSEEDLNLQLTEYDVTNPKYGAIPNDGQSDQAAIMAAIADAEANDNNKDTGGGIISFPAGEFLVNTDADTTADGKFIPIVIRNSNIVLRGSGSRAGGTVIRQVNSMYENYSGGGWPAMFRFRYRGNPMKSISVTENATRETFWITVADASKFKVGDWVTLKLEDKAAVADFMGGFTPRSNWAISGERGAVVDEKHRIAEIQNNRMRFHEPLHANVNSNYNWKVHEYKFLEEVGVEDISFHGSWTGDFVHHKNYIHDYSWYMLQFSGCVNSWVRRVSFINTSIALGINGSAMSVYHVTLAGNKGHFAFLGSTDHSWIGLSEDLAGHQHGPNIQGPRSGNVYYRYDYPASLDFHAQKSGEPIATLFDRAKGGNLSGSSGVCSRNCPHHLGHFVAYNFHQGEGTPNYNFWNGTGRVVIKPIIIGLHGNPATIDENTVQLNESQGSAVAPESLFDAQLELRLGAIPDWLKALRTEWETIRNTSLPNFLPPDRTPPTLIGMRLETEEISAGSYTGELNLIYNEKLNPVTEVPSDAYAVSIQGVQGAITIEGVRSQRENYLANNKNTVTIDLSWTGQAGATFTAQDVMLTYTPPHHESDRDNKRVEDYGGIPAGNLTNYQATR